MFHRQPSLSPPLEHESNSAVPSVYPCFASPPLWWGCCLSASFPPLQPALKNGVVDAGRGFIPLKEYRMLEHGFFRELDVFHLSFDSPGVRMWYFGTISGARKGPQLDACKSCHICNSCSKHPKKLHPFSTFSPQMSILR